MNIALIAPFAADCRSNAGAHMITAGIKYLLTQAIPESRFVFVEMLHDDPQQWNAAVTCDAAVLCGNPRFSVSTDDAWWESGIWERLAQLAISGVRVIDGWAGATVGLDVSDEAQAAERLALLPRVAEALRCARLLRGVITRDTLAARVYASAGIEPVGLPCSSWWARRAYTVERQVEKRQDAIVLLAQPAHAWIAQAIERMQQAMGAERPCLLIATSADDWLWARGVGLQAELVTEPGSLLRLYAQCRRVVSFRVHAAIPAASIGAEVGLIAIDSRARIVEPFGIPVTSFHEIEQVLPPCAAAIAPDTALVVQTLRSMLC